MEVHLPTNHRPQLVNIVRDVGFDASTLDRIYLPQDDMAVTGATDADFAQGIEPSAATRETIKRVSLKVGWWSRGWGD